MEGAVVFFIVLITLVIVLAFVAFVAGAFADIAEQKGHERRRYWHWVFWTGLIGMLMVLALPDLKAQQYQVRIADKLDTMNKHLEKLNHQAATQAAPGSAAATLSAFELPEL